ncbi:YlmH family RNA-binding protein [Ligilactobacillus salivarius]|uniref:YlmH family RNA-binding protein n=1 Tax=Ligilactobacillus salivarius TaxID=1624 RepID=UPI0009DAA85E|nr:RNA-binding protein [Ligilactobacillus salivarius]OQR01918.1 RNA-binding protein [Ligilactobacillus salivarius]
MDSNILQHFRKDEEPLISQLSDYIMQAENEYRPILTHFLNPREQYIAQSLIHKNQDVKVSFSGGYENAERKRAIFYPSYYEVQDDDFNLELIMIKYPVKFTSLTHGQILGTLANSGLDREVIGDIIEQNDTWQFLCEKEVSDYFRLQIDRVGKIKVRLEDAPLDEIVVPELNWQEKMVTSSSLRIDSLVSVTFNISRESSKNLIKAEKVQLNWMTVARPDYEVKYGDIVSIRGYGRLRIDDLLGITRKDKLRIRVSVLEKNN